MEIEYDLYENPGKDGDGSQRLHAKVVTKNVVTTKNLRENITRKCTATPADVAAVLTAISDELYDALSNGYSVHIDGLGYFSLSLSCNSEIGSGNMDNVDVWVRGIKFVPEKVFVEKFETANLVRVKDESRHSEKITDEEVMKRLETYFAKNQYMQRTDFEELTGFNLSKSSRYIKRLVDDGVLKNIASKFHPVYVFVRNE